MRFLTLISIDFLKKLSSLLFLAFTFTAAFSQEGTVSPYSRYGLGDLQFGGLATEVGMGSIGAGVRNQFHLNYTNPASYSGLRYTTFETAGSGQFVEFETQEVKGNTNSASFSYMALGFPIISGKWGAAFGLMPFSDIGYDLKTQDIISQVGRVDYRFQGSGGINRFFVGTGITLFKKLAIGVNASYLFGTLERTRKVEFPDQLYYFNTQSNVSTSLHDFYFNYGLQYILQLPKEREIVFGASGAIASKISTTNDLLTYNYTLSSGGIYNYKDTVEEISGKRGSTTLPFSCTGGLVFKKGMKWTAGADFTFQNWSKFQSFGANDSLSDSYRLSAGGQYVADYSSPNILRRINYRAGVRYAQTYLNLRNTPLNDWALTVGFGVPLRIKTPPRVVPVISLSVEAGRRGTTSENLLKEQYLRFHVGITISEEWFLKRKFD
jgi:hypothetical protein